MSHVAKVKVKIKDLDALATACDKLGLKLNIGQKTYRWYGRSVGNYALPSGFNANELGKCEHAISIPGNKNAYEIGICRNRDGSEGYAMLWDFWQGGFGMQDKVGKDCQKLVNEYTTQVARNEVTSLAKSQGWFAKETFDEQTGETTFTLRKY